MPKEIKCPLVQKGRMGVADICEQSRLICNHCPIPMQLLSAKEKELAEAKKEIESLKEKYTGNEMTMTPLSTFDRAYNKELVEFMRESIDNGKTLIIIARDK